MKIYDLKTEYRNNPIGLDISVPRFSWKMRTDEKNTVQSIYRIEVNTDKKNVWDSGMRESSDSVLVPYEGETLCNETLYNVKVTVWDNYGRADSAEATFETGIFDPKIFRAQMITHDFENDRVIVVSGDNWHQGIIGIVASRVTEKYGLPSLSQ